MEEVLNIFRNDAFSYANLRRMVDNTPYVPGLLGDMKLFDPKPTTSEFIIIYEEDGNIRLIPMTERGAPDIQQVRDQGRFYALKTRRLAKMDSVRASEFLNIGNTALPETVRAREASTVVAKRTGQLQRDMEMTKELHRLGAIQGKLMDADGTTVAYDYFAEFGISAPPLIDVDFAGLSEEEFMMFFQMNFYTPMMLSLGEKRRTAQTYVGAIVGDGFWLKLQTHPGFREIWKLNMQAQAVARAMNPLVMPNQWQRVDFGGVTWINYQGSTGGEISVPFNEARFFPVNAIDVFDVYWSPGETFDQVREAGKPAYLMVQPDVRTAMPTHIDIFLRAYPLYACIYPKALMKARVKP
jgi:hypothetical protein